MLKSKKHLGTSGIRPTLGRGGKKNYINGEVLVKSTRRCSNKEG